MVLARSVLAPLNFFLVNRFLGWTKAINSVKDFFLSISTVLFWVRRKFMYKKEFRMSYWVLNENIFSTHTHHKTWEHYILWCYKSWFLTFARSDEGARSIRLNFYVIGIKKYYCFYCVLPKVLPITHVGLPQVWYGKSQIPKVF